MNSIHRYGIIWGASLSVPGMAVSAHPQPEKQFPSCSSILVTSDNSCDSLAARCGIPTADLTTFNPSLGACSSPPVGKLVCCSGKGQLKTPLSPQDDGLCSNYIIQYGDICESIAGGYGITVDQLDSYNSRAWKWDGVRRDETDDWARIASVNPCPEGECCSLESGLCHKDTSLCSSTAPTTSIASATSTAFTASTTSTTSTASTTSSRSTTSTSTTTTPTTAAQPTETAPVVIPVSAPSDLTTPKVSTETAQMTVNCHARAN
ncbi:glycoside hydrolase [Penicillium capsulatum]|uniref:Glycoside hydrolase n=1 Tax=Penicillium capsulatum TaxID=69766 RepID=A0A9W9ILX0_9EURO|nr:glycoside hydrolase [Penicillium capsulatum]